MCLDSGLFDGADRDTKLEKLKRVYAKVSDSVGGDDLIDNAEFLLMVTPP